MDDDYEDIGDDVQGNDDDQYDDYQEDEEELDGDLNLIGGGIGQDDEDDNEIKGDIDEDEDEDEVEDGDEKNDDDEIDRKDGDDHDDEIDRKDFDDHEITALHVKDDLNIDNVTYLQDNENPEKVYSTIFKAKETYYATRFEMVRAVGERAQQLAYNAPTALTVEEIGDLTDSISIAELELKLKKSPIIIRRTYPDGRIIDIPIHEMNLGGN